MRSLLKRMRRLRDDESGSIAVETIMMVPLLAWALLSTLAYFDAYRAESISVKAGLTIADMVSRETGFVTNPYINGTRDLLQFLTIDDNWPDLRVTVVRWDESRNRLRRVWSQERGPRRPLRGTEMAGLVDRLPELTDNERLIIVETWTDYTPLYSVGLSPFTMETFTFISPRFVSQLCYKPQDTTPDADAVC
ncbi:MAG: TadE/TadG family type IV pilus assembly protein [Paracoccaceae bacterium]